MKEVNNNQAQQIRSTKHNQTLSVSQLVYIVVALLLICTLSGFFLPSIIHFGDQTSKKLPGLRTSSVVLTPILENNTLLVKTMTSKFQAKREELLRAAEEKQSLTKVDFSNMQLSEFPLELLLPFKDSLEFINLGGNHLSSLPDELALFQKIQILFFAGNSFETVPTVLGQLPALYMLSFKGNKLRIIAEESLSPSIIWLILTDNQLTGIFIT